MSIIEFKQAHGLTWQQVSKLLGVTVGACHFWRRGERSVPGTVVRLLSLYNDHPKLIKTILSDS